MKKLLATALLITALSLSAAAQDPGVIITGSDKTQSPPPPPPAGATASTSGDEDTSPIEDETVTIILSVMNALIALP